MYKTVITSVIALILSFTAIAQDKKVAVFDPAGSVPSYMKDIVREEISSMVVNLAGYTVLERSLINKVLEENKFQSGGLVEDKQISEIGRMMGANYVFVTTLTIMDNGNYYISCKMIDVLTARIEKQKTAQTYDASNDLVTTLQKMVGDMFGVAIKSTATKPKPTQQTSQGMAYDRSTDYDYFRSLRDDDEMSKFLERYDYDDSYKIFHKGEKLSGAGKGLMIPGIILTPIGATLLMVGFLIDYDELLFSGVGILSGGQAMLITGITLRSFGGLNKKKGKLQYEGKVFKEPTATLNLDIYPNGFGFSIKF